MRESNNSIWWPTHPVSQAVLCIVLLATSVSAGLDPLPGKQVVNETAGGTIVTAMTDPFAFFLNLLIIYTAFAIGRALFVILPERRHKALLAAMNTAEPTVSGPASIPACAVLTLTEKSKSEGPFKIPDWVCMATIFLVLMAVTIFFTLLAD